jgi:hypothetical protein
MGRLCVCVYIYKYFKSAFYKRVQNLTYVTFNQEELSFGTRFYL